MVFASGVLCLDLVVECYLCCLICAFILRWLWCFACLVCCDFVLLFVVVCICLLVVHYLYCSFCLDVVLIVFIVDCNCLIVLCYMYGFGHRLYLFLFVYLFVLFIFCLVPGLLRALGVSFAWVVCVITLFVLLLLVYSCVTLLLVWLGFAFVAVFVARLCVGC